ncbi:MAG TPA: hypothetical protein VFK89_05845, partial [Actinomycetota bacterium]|nr:hypothetical protein [Actinomycetota bacterium]
APGRLPKATWIASLWDTWAPSGNSVAPHSARAPEASSGAVVVGAGAAVSAGGGAGAGAGAGSPEAQATAKSKAAVVQISLVT